MSRILKGTRARGLPPKVLLSQRQDATGSFPTKWRTSSDNRTGKYPVFFSDNKVVPFNQYEAADYDSSLPLGDAIYVEEIFHMAPGLVDTLQINFSPLFPGYPIVVISELSSSDNSQNVNVFFKDVTNSKIILGFSTPFSGSFVYRAVYDPSPGTLRVVERKPRYPNAFTRFLAETATLTDTNSVDITFNDSGDDTAENFVTFFDSSGNGQADIWPNITTQTRTLVALTASSIATATVEYERFHHGLHNRGIIYPLGMNQATILAGLSQENQIEMYGSVSFISGAVVNQPTKWIVASGSMKKNVADTFVTFTPGQDIKAFRDNNNPAVDGKLSSSLNGINPFYATGSAVEVTGQGFQQPLWGKSKIEINIAPSVFQKIGADLNSSANYPMCYWNNVSKQYDGVGNGAGVSAPYGTTLADLKTYLSSQAIGFGATLGGGGISQNDLARLEAMGYPISNFGFPYDPKFQPNANQQLLMQNYISEPFLLEKIVVELSCSLETNAITFSGGSRTAMWSFFVLNSRPEISEKIVGNQTIYYFVGVGGSFSSFVTSSISSDSVSDLITFAQVSFYDPVQTLYGPVRDQIVVPTKELTSTYWNGHLVLSSSIRNPIGYEKGLFGGFGGENFLYIEDLRISGRSQINQANGRDWKSSFESPSVIGYWSDPTGEGINIPILSAYKKENPYILFPTDKLTFGWHMPNKENEYAGSPNVSDMSFFTTGINKITLYGSSLRVNPETNQLEEHHDTLNQLLSSNSICEIIGD